MDVKIKILADCFIGIPMIAVSIIGIVDFMIQKIKRVKRRSKK